MHLVPTRWIAFFVCVACLINANGAASQATIQQLNEAVSRGDIAVEGVTGTGGSSGMVIEGFLANQSSVDRNISVHLTVPIYLANDGKGQNMIATQVYGRDGLYFREGIQRFVRVSGHSRTPVVFVAYCADFDKDNPTKADSFNIAEMPPGIEGVVRNISQVEWRNPQADLTAAAQLALWTAQGKRLDEIRERFHFSEVDMDWMHKILRFSAPSDIPEANTEH